MVLLHNHWLICACVAGLILGVLIIIVAGDGDILDFLAVDGLFDMIGDVLSDW